MEGTLNKPPRDLPSEVKLDLFVEILRSFGEAKLAVTGISMVPAIWPRDILSVRSHDIVQAVPGDIIVFRYGGRLVAHRVVERVDCQNGIQWVTRGDSACGNDIPVSSDELLGRVTAVRRGAHWFTPRRSLSRRLTSWILCRSDLVTRGLLRLGKLSFRYPKSRERTSER